MANRKKKIGIVGCGTIGAQLAKAIRQRFSEQAELTAICDLDNTKAQKLKADIAPGVEITSLDELIEQCDLIVEAASAKISAVVAQKALEQGKEAMIMSVGGLLDGHKQLFALAKAKGGRLYLPSGAIGGLDALKAAAMAKISKATLITRKPPQGLTGAPYLLENKIDLSQIKQETEIFSGSAAEAVKGFPKNVNVSAVLSLAGIGAENTKVKIVTSPDYKSNTHEIEVEGEFGRLTAKTENVPSPENPKTSYLASLSAMATLKSVLDPVKIGT